MAAPHVTFQKILPGCERGEREAWRTFVASYTPVASSLLGVYVPQMGSGARLRLWSEFVHVLAREDGARLREPDHQGERECLVDLKGILLDHAAAQLAPGQDNTGILSPTTESLSGLLHRLPLAQQEIALLKLAGYSDLALEKMLLASPSLIQKATAPLEADYGSVLKRAEDACPWPAAWLAVLRAARAGRGPQCPSPRIFVRILDGQVSWYDKTPAEAHVARCLHCLESWASLREVSHLRHVANPAPPQDVEELLSFLPANAIRETQSSWLGRLLGR